MSAPTALGELAVRAGLDAGELLARLRALGGWAHLAVHELEAVAGGAVPGPGLLRAWVWACDGSAEDEALAWHDAGWPLDEARDLVAALPPFAPQLRCAACGDPVDRRRRGGARSGEGTYCGPTCRKRAQRSRQAPSRVTSRVTTPCACCGSPVPRRRRGGARSGEGTYCSDGCRASAWRRRRAIGPEADSLDDVARQHGLAADGARRWASRRISVEIRDVRDRPDARTSWTWSVRRGTAYLGGPAQSEDQARTRAAEALVRLMERP